MPGSPGLPASVRGRRRRPRRRRRRRSPRPTAAAAARRRRRPASPGTGSATWSPKPLLPSCAACGAPHTMHFLCAHAAPSSQKNDVGDTRQVQSILLLRLAGRVGVERAPKVVGRLGGKEGLVIGLVHRGHAPSEQEPFGGVPWRAPVQQLLFPPAAPTAARPGAASSRWASCSSVSALSNRHSSTAGASFSSCP